MTRFRIWFYSRGGHISDVIELSAADVEQAIERADFHADGRQMELWRDGQRLHTWPAQPEVERR